MAVIEQPTGALVPKVKWAAIAAAAFAAFTIALSTVLPDLAETMPGWLYSVLTGVVAIAGGYFKRDET